MIISIEAENCDSCYHGYKGKPGRVYPCNICRHSGLVNRFDNEMYPESFWKPVNNDARTIIKISETGCYNCRHNYRGKPGMDCHCYICYNSGLVNRFDNKRYPHSFWEPEE